jgi:hypothetical protein
LDFQPLSPVKEAGGRAANPAIRKRLTQRWLGTRPSGSLPLNEVRGNEVAVLFGRDSQQSRLDLEADAQTNVKLPVGSVSGRFVVGWGVPGREGRWWDGSWTCEGWSRRARQLPAVTRPGLPVRLFAGGVPGRRPTCGPTCGRAAKRGCECRAILSASADKRCYSLGKGNLQIKMLSSSFSKLQMSALSHHSKQGFIIQI